MDLLSMLRINRASKTKKINKRAAKTLPFEHFYIYFLLYFNHHSQPTTCFPPCRLYGTQIPGWICCQKVVLFLFSRGQTWITGLIIRTAPATLGLLMRYEFIFFGPKAFIEVKYLKIQFQLLKLQMWQALHSTQYTLHLHQHLYIHLYTSYYTLNTAHHKLILHFEHLSLNTAHCKKLPEMGPKMVVAKWTFLKSN